MTCVDVDCDSGANILSSKLLYIVLAEKFKVCSSSTECSGVEGLMHVNKLLTLVSFGSVLRSGPGLNLFSYTSSEHLFHLCLLLLTVGRVRVMWVCRGRGLTAVLVWCPKQKDVQTQEGVADAHGTVHWCHQQGEEGQPLSPWWQGEDHLTGHSHHSQTQQVYELQRVEQRPPRTEDRVIWLLQEQQLKHYLLIRKTGRN